MKTLSLSTLFGDYAVFAKGLPICVFGDSTLEGDVTLTLANGERREAHFVPENGKFSVLLSAVDYYAEDAVLTVKTAEETHTASHIAIGIVLLAGGQSNMELMLRDVERPRALYPSDRLRMYTEKHVINNDGSISAKLGADEWYCANGEKELVFSAIGYMVAEQLAQTLSVTVGVLSCNQGASRIEAWLSPEAEEKSGALPIGKPLLEMNRAFNHNHWLYYNKYLPVAAYTYSAVLWYQGESNTGFGERGNYEKYLRTLFAEWRAANANKDLPFYLVELAPFDSVKAGWAPEPLGDWAPIREVLVKASVTERNVYTVSLTEVADVSEIHPTNKYPVAEKLARAILATQYGYALEYRGPLLSSFEQSGDALILSFSHAEGLALRDREGASVTVAEDAWFEMKDGTRESAAMALQGEKAVLSVPKDAVAFSLGYADVPCHNLYNKEGYLASPFRITF